MSSGYLELFWALLEGSRFDEIKSSIPENFDWSVLHPARKSTILVEAISAGQWTDLKSLDNIEWLIRHGASYSQRCGRSELSWTRWQHNKPDLKLRVGSSGHSCVSYIQAWKRELRDKEGWNVERNWLEEALASIARASCQQQTRPRACVDEGIVEIWEKFLHATASHDLTIQTADGQVTAHSGMLQEASPVVQAMLASPMTEAKSQRIQLKDTSHSAVEPVVAILADLLQNMITEESFPAIAEHAALKHLDTLKQACRKFGSECAAIQGRIKKGQFPKVVQDLFQLVETSPSEPVKKRKRL
eukprot:Skav206530  [mRNA]  locus=scaffold504:37345:38347:+ [translate_table: standard]